MTYEKPETLLLTLAEAVKESKDALTQRLELTFQSLCALEKDHDGHEEEGAAEQPTVH